MSRLCCIDKLPLYRTSRSGQYQILCENYRDINKCASKFKNL